MEFERKLFNCFVIPGIITEILVIVLGLNISLLSNPIGGPAGMVAGLVMSQLEAAGIVGPQIGKSKNREVLVNSLEELDTIIKSYLK